MYREPLNATALHEKLLSDWKIQWSGCSPILGLRSSKTPQFLKPKAYKGDTS
jgi:hypothetical protein